MNIASDKEGEVIAFGTTVPHITPSTSTSQIEEHCAFLVNRLVAAIDSTLITPDDAGIVVVPAPIKYEDSDSLFSIQETSMRTALAITRSCAVHGYTVVSCTPAALTDRVTEVKDTALQNIPDTVFVGNVLLIAKHSDAAKYVASFDSALGVAGVWTEYADKVYGKAAINRVMQEMQQQIIEASNQSVH